jgi:hypothetical protein
MEASENKVVDDPNKLVVDDPNKVVVDDPNMVVVDTAVYELQDFAFAF